MIMILGLTAGMSACMLRSVMGVVVVAFLIVACFAIAALTGPVSIMELVWAVLGYNLGLAMTLGGYIVFSSNPSDMR